MIMSVEVLLHKAAHYEARALEMDRLGDKAAASCFRVNAKSYLEEALEKENSQ